MPAVVVVCLPPCSCSAVSLARRSAYFQYAVLDYSVNWIACCCWTRSSLALAEEICEVFFMADLSFLGTSCSRFLCCVLLVVGADLVGVAVISSLLQVPFPASIVECVWFFKVGPYPFYVVSDSSSV